MFVPSDPKYTWMLAKMYYNNADAAFHQSCTHLGKRFGIYHSLMPLGSPQSISQKMFLPFQVAELNPCVTSMKRKLFLICMVEIPCWLTTVASGVSV